MSTERGFSPLMGWHSRTNRGDGKLTKSSPKCDQVVASSASLSFCVQAHKTSRRAATNLSSAITAVMERTVCGLGNGFGFSVSRKNKKGKAHGVVLLRTVFKNTAYLGRVMPYFCVCRHKCSACQEKQTDFRGTKIRLVRLSSQMNI